MSVPSSVVPWKNSTRLTVPSLSEALTLIVMLAGALKLAPVVGAVIATVGGLFGSALTSFELILSPAALLARTSED